MLVEYIVKKMKKGLEKSVTGTTETTKTIGTGTGLNLLVPVEISMFSIDKIQEIFLFA